MLEAVLGAVVPEVGVVLRFFDFLLFIEDGGDIQFLLEVIGFVALLPKRR